MIERLIYSSVLLNVVSSLVFSCNKERIRECLVNFFMALTRRNNYVKVNLPNQFIEFRKAFLVQECLGVTFELNSWMKFLDICNEKKPLSECHLFLKGCSNKQYKTLTNV